MASSRLLPQLQLLALLVGLATALNNGITRPPMGWNTWNRFACDPGPNDALIRDIADFFASSGLRDAGYTYINVDDCWQEMRRTDDGLLLANATRFPNGIKAVADYVHSRGLKFGMYNSAGKKTCAGYPGSQFHEPQDAATFAEWGIDYLKYDNCYPAHHGVWRSSNIQRFTAMRDALNATGREIHYSMCNWGQASSWEFADGIANSWRISGDIGDTFDRNGGALQCGLCTAPGPCLIIKFGLGASHCSVKLIADIFAKVGHHGSVGAYNDLDMLEVGNGGMTVEEYRSHFTIWAAAKSPLLLGNDIRNMTKEDFEIITNKEIIALNQDPLGVPITRTHQDFDSTGTATLDVWTGPLVDDACVLIIWNRENRRKSHAASFSHSFFASASSSMDHAIAVRDLWAHRDLPGLHESIDDAVLVKLEPHGVVALKLTKVARPERSTLVFADESI